MTPPDLPDETGLTHSADKQEALNKLGSGSPMQAFREGFQQGFEDSIARSEGEVRIHADGAPDRDDHNDYQDYLIAVDHWAAEAMAEPSERLRRLAAQADDQLAEYPELGLDRREDDQQRARFADWADSILEAVASIEHYRQIREQVQQAWSDR